MSVAPSQATAGISHHVRRIVMSTEVRDIHTHLYDPAFGSLLLWGIDDLLVYHYLVAESFRVFEQPYASFWKLGKEAQADLIWDALFMKQSPISEACQGVVTTMQRLGLDLRKRDLPALRKWFAGWKPADYVTHCLDLARVKSVCMTNSPFDDQERPVWEQGFTRDGRFTAALRIDPLLVNWPDACGKLREWGYAVEQDLTPRTIEGIQKFLRDWSKKIDAQYLMVSFPSDFKYPAETTAARILQQAVLPFCEEAGLPFSPMLGVRRSINPHLRLAGDGVGLSDMQSLQNLCAQHPRVKFLATILARENHHEACVLARKFPNLHLFGCWWFTNIPYLVHELTQMRVELLGLSFTAQHSDARVLDQLIYKWDHSRRVIADVLTPKYEALAANGWPVTPETITADVQKLTGGSYDAFLEFKPGHLLQA